MARCLVDSVDPMLAGVVGIARLSANRGTVPGKYSGLRNGLSRGLLSEELNTAPGRSLGLRNGGLRGGLKFGFLGGLRNRFSGVLCKRIQTRYCINPGYQP